MSDIKQKILDTVCDLVSDFMFYDRKEDDDLPRGAIEQAVHDGEITYEEIIDKFKEQLLK